MPRASANPARSPDAVIRRRTPRGWRLIQHGTVLSEVLRQPGPTQSVFDVLAAACLLPPPPRHLALLGFGGGGTLAALRALGTAAQVHGVDLDPHGFDLLQDLGAADWMQPFAWSEADALPWLRRTRRQFDVVLEDLSVPLAADVEKPPITWDTLPRLIRKRLHPGGLAVINLLRPPAGGWNVGLRRVALPFTHALVVSLADFENRILITADRELDARATGSRLRLSLRALGSRQADRIAVHRLATLPH